MLFFITIKMPANQITPQAVFILVRPQFSGNLGSIARVLRNFGQKELRLVSPAARWTEEARRMAVGADPLVEQAQRFTSLEEAVADLQWTLATASLRARSRAEGIPLRQAMPRIAKRAQANRLGFVFGPEASGLTAREIGLCRSLVYIPASRSHPTLNLAQAVAIVAYELFLTVVTARRARSLASSASMEGMFSHLQEALFQIGFLHENNPDRMLRLICRILSRAELSEGEVVIMRGIFRQILWAAKKNDGRE
ncbi:MAG: TrmJ/YjtD family RNA methyltransferase [Acidobacteria bacterium]|nr:TrmJ/YjtD family RNA methyltransferase [Acidobacteriota bacterium]